MTPLDHRTRTAAARRARMRAHLIRCALELYTRQGIDGSIIDELIRSAGVSRGTFYNYFKTSEDLFEAVSADISKDLMTVVDPIVQRHDDPALRVCTGVRACLELGKQHPHMAMFISKGGPAALGENHLLAEYLPRDLAMGIEAGQFARIDMRLAVDLVVGPVLAGFYSIATGAVKPGYIETLALSVLCSLGLDRAEASRLALTSMDAITVPDYSVIARSATIATKNGTSNP